MYGAVIGDTGIFDDRHKGVVRAVAIWSPWEHRVVYFRNFNCHHLSFQEARIVLIEKVSNFKIDSYYKNDNYDFVGNRRPEFITIKD